jgi:autotransporter-associated beta strand protein
MRPTLAHLSRSVNRFTARRRPRASLAVIAWGVAMLLPAVARAQAVAISLSGSTYQQTFDAMASTSSAAVPQGWGIFRSSTSTVTPAFSSGSTSTVVTQLAGSAASTAPTSGGAYLWVTGSAATGTDKAIGFLSSGGYPGPTSTSTSSSLAILFGFTNDTGSTITDLNLSWNYEKYRSGTRAFDWTFFSSTDGSTWSPVTLGDQSYAGDGTNTVMSNPPLTTGKSVAISSLNISSASPFYLRWSYAGVGGFSNGQGLGLDDFSLTATYSSAALDLYWDGAGGWVSTAPGSGGPGTWADGTGSWDSSLGANFGGTAASVTVGSVTAGRGIKFNTTGYTLAGGTISLNGTQGLNALSTGTDSTVTATVNSVLAGSNGFTKVGGGTLVLDAANTVSGTVAVNAGTLQVASDSALGDAANDVVLFGTLKSTASIAMGAGRDLTGGGTFDIAPGTKLTSNGLFGLTATTLTNSGTLDLQGATRSVGTLTFASPAAIDGAGPISLTGLSAAAVTSGSAVINPAITFTTGGDKPVDVGSGGTLVVNGDVAGTTGRIAKTGAGTLVVNGANTTSGYRIGAAGAAPTNGGTVVIGNAAGSGTGQLQFNYGTLTTTVPGGITFTNGVSIGGRSGAVAVIDGSQPVTFSGSSSFFKSFGTSGEMRLDVNNTTTISGTLGATTSSGNSTGFTLGGTGRLILAATGVGASGSASFTERVTVNPGATLEIANETALAAASLNTSGGGTITFSVPAATVGGLVGGDPLALQTNASAPLALTVSPTSTGTFSGILSGAGSLAKTGAGTLSLAGANTYTGTTAISGGTLLVNGDQTAATGAVSVLAGGTLGGIGVVGGATTIESAATLAPGNSPGTLAFARDLSWNTGGNYNWQILSGTGSAGAGDTWDLVTLSGTLVVAATSADPFRINLWSLSAIGPDVSGDATNFDAAQNYTWKIASATGGISGFAADKFVINTSAANGAAGFSNPLAGGTFSLAQSGNDLNLVFTSASGPTAITIDVASGTQTQTQAGYPTLSGSTPIVKTGGGTLVLDQANTLTGSTTVQGGVVRLANASALSTSKLVVVAGGTGQLAPFATTSVASLDLATGNGLMDVTSGALTIASGMTAPQLVAELLEGRADGSWTGTSGITSSTAAADIASSQPRAVGWLDNGDGSFTVAYAAPGDTNIDWSIDILDASNFLALGKFDTGLPATWIEGDFSYDGIVDILDAADFFATGLYDAGNYNAAPGAAGGVAAVPEPALPAGLLVAAAAAVALRRRRA